MTTLVEPTPDSTVDASPLATALHYGIGDWVTRAGSYVHADDDNRLGTVSGAFEYVSSSGFDVTIGDGEAHVGGHWLATDATRTVTLASSTSDQTVYLGVDRSQPNTIIVGLDGAFPSAADPRIAIHEFDTDGSGVTSHTSLRPLGPENAQTDLVYSKIESDNRYVEVAGGGLEADLDFQQHSALNRQIEQRTSRPANPVHWQEWVRTDTDEERIEVYTPQGYRQVALDPINQVIDDMEDGDLTEWQTESGVSVNNRRPYQGTYSMYIDGYSRAVSYPGDGLLNYPQPGDHWQFYVNIDNWPTGGQHRFYFAIDGSGFTLNSYYAIHMYDDGTFRLRDHNGAISGSLETTSVNYSEDNWYRVDSWWQHPDKADDHVLTLTDVSTGDRLASVSGDESSLGRGGIEVYSNIDTLTYTDEIQIIERTQ
jgi:hypothetical protein